MAYSGTDLSGLCAGSKENSTTTNKKDNFIKIGLIADVHLCKTQYGNNNRREQIKNSLISYIRNANATGVKTILCAGDFLDSNNPGVDIVVRDIPEIDNVLKELRMRMYITKGNHDNVEPSWYSIIPNAVGKEKKYGIFPVKDEEVFKTPEGITVRGYDYGHKDRLKFLAKDPSTFMPPTDIVMFHGAVTDWIGFPSDHAVALSEFALDEDPANCPRIVLIGDTHVSRYAMNKVHETMFVSPGSVDVMSKTDAQYGIVGRYAAFNPHNHLDFYLGDVFYEHTIVLFYSINCMDDIDMIDKEIEQQVDAIKKLGLIMFIDYNPKLDKVSPKIYSILDRFDLWDYTNLRMKPQKQTEDDKVDKLIENARTIKESPAEFYRTHKKDFFSDDIDKDVDTLCCSILNPSDDSKRALTNFVQTRLGTEVV